MSCGKCSASVAGSVNNGSRNPPAVQDWTVQCVGSVPDPSNNLTHWLLLGQTWTPTRQPAGFAEFG